VKGSGTTLTLNKGNLISPDFSVTGGAGAVFGSGVNMTFLKGNLSESGSSVFIISNGNSALFGNGASIQFRQAGSAQSGYLSSSDWKTFNNKVSSPWASNGSELHYATGNVGIGTSNPASDACLELSSTTAGFLPPSMTRFQRDALQNPAAGLMIICSDCPLPFNFQVYTGTSWLPIPMNRYPVALNVEQSGGPYFQNTISGVYTYQDEDLDAEGATQLQWYRADNSLGINEMPISGATNTTYDLTLADIDKYIRFSVIPAAQTGATPGIEVKSAVFLGPVSSFGCGSSAFNVYHNPAGGVAPILTSFSYNSVTNIPGEDGKCWITRNLGAPVAPNAVNDTRQEVAGWYWQFNRKQGYQHDGSALTPAWNFVPINENSNWLPSNDPCALELDAPWRLPTETEWFNVSSTGDWDDWNGPWNSGLKLHAAGQITSAGFISSRGFTGYYTSSVQYTNTLNYYLVFNDGVCGQSNSNKSNGYTVRCIREN
jgi:hypothetical protein